MFEALGITLREGGEAALVLAITLSLLERRGLSRLRGALFAGAGVALLASAGVAMAATRLTWNQELAEGIAMLVGFGLVLTLVCSSRGNRSRRSNSIPLDGLSPTR